MFEAMTYEVILERMLEKVPGDLDKREGSIIYDALAPAALEMGLMYAEMDHVLREAFADTATIEYLRKMAKERGIEMLDATPAICRLTVEPKTIDLAIGQRFSVEKLNFEVTEKLPNGDYKVACETPGTAGNNALGFATPISYAPGLTLATIAEVLIPGRDDEGAESLRTRYFNSYKIRPFAGNKAAYVDNINTIPGVGGTKVLRSTAPNNNVSVYIIGSNFSAASSELIQSVKEAVDPDRLTGQGYGLAPIGHFVNVQSATAVAVAVDVTLTMDPQYTIDEVRSTVTAAAEAFMLDKRKAWQSTENTYIRKGDLEDAIVKVRGVADAVVNTLNGSSDNLRLEPSQFPTIKGVTAHA